MLVRSLEGNRNIPGIYLCSSLVGSHLTAKQVSVLFSADKEKALESPKLKKLGNMRIPFMCCMKVSHLELKSIGLPEGAIRARLHSIA